MRGLIFAALLGASSLAIAQEVEQPQDSTAQPTDMGTMPMPQQGESTDATQPPPPATGEQQMPPEGVNVPAQVPPGAPVVMTPGQEALTPRPATTDYPICSRTVRDSCRQARDPK